MNPDLMAQLSRSQRAAVESAGYRVVRWAAAREVLQTRVEKGRIAGPVGEFLTHWMSLAPTHEDDAELWLSFDDELKLAGGGAVLARSPLERAFLHLPALRPFWRQELRQQHFDALRILIPQAWLLDPAQVPPGAVIQGLGSVSWEQARQKPEREWEIQDPKGLVRKDGSLGMAGRESILTAASTTGVLLNARYGRNEAGQVVLRTIEEAAP